MKYNRQSAITGGTYNGRYGYSVISDKTLFYKREYLNGL